MKLAYVWHLNGHVYWTNECLMQGLYICGTWCWTAASPVHKRWKMMQLCTHSLIKCKGCVLMPHWHQATVYMYDNLIYVPYEISYVWYCNGSICDIWVECPMQAKSTGWLDAGLRYLLCISMEMLWSCTKPSIYSAWAVAWCLTGTRMISISIITLYIHYEISYMCDIEMAVRVPYGCHMQVYISGGFDAGLRYLQCVSDVDAAVLHQAMI